MAREARRRRVQRQRAGLAAAFVAGLVVLAWIVLGGGDDNQEGTEPEKPATVVKKRPRPSPVDRVLTRTDYIVEGTRRHREVALTFDDGPSPYTLRILRTLRDRHTPATFFPVGQAINEYPRILRRVRRRGFPIGDHTMSHPLMGHLPRDRQRRETDEQAQILERIGAPYPRLFRPPDGSFHPDTRALLARRRMLMVLWSVNPQDYFRPGARAIVQRVMDGVRPGSIVLLHDGGGDRSQTVAAVPALIRKLRARGFRIVSVPRLLRDAPPPRGQGPPPNLSGV